MIRVTINGRPRQLEGPTALPELLAREAGERLEAVAVGINRRVIPRHEWHNTCIDEGDDIEIIAPLAGG